MLCEQTCPVTLFSYQIIGLHMARWLRCLHCHLTARRSWVRFPQGSLGASVLRWAISRAFLCGVCMFSPCSQGVSATKNPNRKNMQKRTEHSLSVPDQDRQFTSLGPRALKSCPLLLWSWRKDSPGWENSQTTSGLPVSPPYIHVCVAVCRLCE